jgi:GT2 family glycosyltransferase|tara:strand:+ start:4166 stop:4936 length:771 start_codon:yes stop_codon:yes gene_type:complete
MISVIIPTYKSPAALDLCLKSTIKGQSIKNQIIVVVDGFYDVNKEVLNKYKGEIDILNLEENVGTARATNLGVFNAKHDKVLIINDDNVSPKNWDINLESDWKEGIVLTPNQIEPYDSMFPQFNINDLGRDPKDFNINKFWEYEEKQSFNHTDETGSTFPFLISKKDYLKVGGLDQTYPSPSGFVADWELFMKCDLVGLKMIRTYKSHFYHFVSLTAKTPDQLEISQQYERNCHEYAKYKWGSYIKHNPQNNIKYI